LGFTSAYAIGKVVAALSLELVKVGRGEFRLWMFLGYAIGKVVVA